MCGEPLAGRPTMRCRNGHAFDVAREGYVNLLVGGRRRSRAGGDDREMVAARRRFLATGAYDPLTRRLREAVDAARPALLLDVGCGEGRHTRALAASTVAGVDVSKPAVALAARAHPDGWYAVANAAHLPVADGAVDVAVNVFGPVVPAELARVVRPGGLVVAAHPGPDHLAALRALVYADARPHEVKPPLRDAAAWFTAVGSETVTFPVVITPDLFAMTPYRWHAPPDLVVTPAETTAEVVVTTYARS